MIELEQAILPELTECIKYWKRYVDDTISFVMLRTISYIITNLNSFNNNIQFTFEEENKGTLLFLDVLIRIKGRSILTTVFRKPGNNDIYLNFARFCTRYWEKRDFKNTSGTYMHSVFYFAKGIKIFRKSFPWD